jgi:hypothetical protein
LISAKCLYKDRIIKIYNSKNIYFKKLKNCNSKKNLYLYITKNNLYFVKSISKIYPKIVFLFIHIKKTINKEIKSKNLIATLVIPNINLLLLSETNSSSEN